MGREVYFKASSLGLFCPAQRVCCFSSLKSSLHPPAHFPFWWSTAPRIRRLPVFLEEFTSKAAPGAPPGARCLPLCCWGQNQKHAQRPWEERGQLSPHIKLQIPHVPTTTLEFLSFHPIISHPLNLYICPSSCSVHAVWISLVYPSPFSSSPIKKIKSYKSTSSKKKKQNQNDPPKPAEKSHE